MENKVVIDSSALIKLFDVTESWSEEVKRLYVAVRGQKVRAFSPKLLVIEMVNTLKNGKKFSMVEIDMAMKKLLKSGLQFIELETNEVYKLNKLMFKYDLTAYDANYLLLAIKKRARLITEDKALLKVKKHCVSLKELEI